MRTKASHEPRRCEICGKEYIPKRSDQRCCLDAECRKGLQLLNYKEYRATHYAKVLEANRRSMAKKREDAKRKEREAKGDTLIAIGYAERQMAETLRMAGGVKTEL